MLLPAFSIWNRKPASGACFFRQSTIKIKGLPQKDISFRDSPLPYSFMVGATGFEPTTSSTPRKRSTKLGYAPTSVYYR